MAFLPPPPSDADEICERSLIDTYLSLSHTNYNCTDPKNLAPNLVELCVVVQPYCLLHIIGGIPHRLQKFPSRFNSRGGVASTKIINKL